MKYGLMFLGMILLSCNGYKDRSAKTATNSKVEEEQLQLIASDVYGGQETEGLLVIGDQKSLQAFYSKVNRTRKPGLPVPEINFEKNLAVVYFGGKTTIGEMPSLMIVKDQDQMFILPEHPDLDSTKKVSGSAILMPFGVYTMPKTEKEVTFKNP